MNEGFSRLGPAYRGREEEEEEGVGGSWWVLMCGSEPQCGDQSGDQQEKVFGQPDLKKKPEDSQSGNVISSHLERSRVFIAPQPLQYFISATQKPRRSSIWQTSGACVGPLATLNAHFIIFL